MELLSLVALIVFLFAMLETRLFSGTFNYCFTDHLAITQIEATKLIKNKWDCYNYGGEWTKPYLNFDTIGSSMLGLSSIQSHEGWLGMMWSSVDATEIDMAPKENNSPFFIFFTLIVIFVICLLSLNLFVGVVIETFNIQKQRLTHNDLLLPEQRVFLRS